MNWNGSIRPAWQRLLAAVILVSAAGALRLLFSDSLGQSGYYRIFYPVVVIAALYGGWLTGGVTSLLTSFLVVYGIQRGGMASAEWVALAVFLITSALITGA